MASSRERRNGQPSYSLCERRPETASRAERSVLSDSWLSAEPASVRLALDTDVEAVIEEFATKVLFAPLRVTGTKRPSGEREAFIRGG